MLLRNPGLLALGPGLPATFSLLWTLQRACEIQLAAQQTGLPLRQVTEQAAQRSTREFPDRQGHQRGQDVFNALWRALDRAGSDYLG
jgi:ribulose-5-phosphate 4-epimerase/fuculose-1-phosphate aldolase